jgi:succinate-acetate transporter protein
LGLYTGFLHDGIQSVGSPLLLFQSHNWDIWLINAFNNINIFWITYIVVLILAIKNNCKLTHKQSSIVVLGSYVSVILLFTVIICLTLILQTGNTPQQFTPDITTN